ncbi:TIR domain-containing protein [Vitreoscilla massiliensis]|uniref:TIR domain-containing protein n=1 Tax=Vitreoscilla massiliensis TaxID=1689272 RepID=A0ABY4E1P8_9NEIS|nr:SEFIR domain-containing protein [Vitreoscilla massiliensis]UOO89164.1 TIR domain-containing protein [Vitreoscilla massiliensis]
MSNPPKLFISYSWSSPEHEDWVLELATSLRQDGVDAMLDKWDLKEGHDSIAFMERMVNDPEITKVLLICDKTYASKANARAGGVGIEAQIVSSELYNKVVQEKFVAVIREYDDNGNAFIPTYYAGKIYINLSSNDEKYLGEYEKLLRWIFNKPLHQKPEIGMLPAYLNEGNHISLNTTSHYKRCLDAIRNDKSNTNGLLADYLNLYNTNLEKFRISDILASEKEIELDDLIFNNISDFLPARNEFIQLVSALIQYSSSNKYINIIHKFFENNIRYLFRPENITSYAGWDFDNFKFIINELFLYFVALMIKNEKFEELNYFLNKNFYFLHHDSREPLSSFLIFKQHCESFGFRNQRLSLGYANLHATTLKERANGINLEFIDLMQADFILYLRAEINSTDTYFIQWWPTTLMYTRSFYPFEIFAKSKSKSYYESMKCILGNNPDINLKALIEDAKKGTRTVPKWQYESISLSRLTDFNNIATI